VDGYRDRAHVGGILAGELARYRDDADVTVPADFRAVSRWYRHFGQVTAAEVAALRQ
jgi:predicted phosphoribosyltransferase